MEFRQQRVVDLKGLAPLLLLTLAAGPALAQDDHSNTASGATVLQADGGAIGGRIESGGDWDVFRFPAQDGVEYTVETTGLAAGMDSLLDLYDPTGQHMVRDDDGGVGYASKITFTAQQTHNYWLVVRHYSRSGTGTYRLSAKSDNGVAPPPPNPNPGPITSGQPLSLSATVFDPALAGSGLNVGSSHSLPYRATVSIYSGSQLVRRLVNDELRDGGRSYTDAWDGADANGFRVAPGRYTIRFQTEQADGARSASQADLDVVRIGIRSVEFLEGNGRVGVAYHRANGFSSPFAVDDAGPAWTLPLSAHGSGCLDASTDAPLSNPAPWTDVNAPPRTSSGAVRTRGRSLPVCYVQGSRPRVEIRLGSSAGVGGQEVGCGFPIAGKPIRVVGPDGSPSSELSPGSRATLTADALGNGIGSYVLTLPFRFQYREDGQWHDLPGEQSTRHPLYTVIDRPHSALVPNGTPWVAALDLASSFTRGEVSSVAGVMRRVTEGINGQLGLVYDSVQGAPAYTDAFQLHYPRLDLGSFLDAQANGRRVNCLDCASLVTAFAAQQGVPAYVVILGWDFRLNYLKGIGGTRFIADLFGGHHAFSYHAVASLDQGNTVHDACLSVDDDSRPWASPFQERLPVAMPFADYRDQLSPDNFRVQDVGHLTGVR